MKEMIFMPYILFLIGAAVFSVCQNLITANAFSVKRFKRFGGIVFSVPLLILCAVFSANRSPDISCYLPVSGISFILGLIIPVIIISDGDRTCSVSERLGYLCVAVSALSVWILSYFKFTVFSAAFCVLLYIVYLILPTKKDIPEISSEKSFRIISLLFSAAGIMLGCAITVKNSIILTSFGISFKYISLGFIAVCAGCARLYSEKRLGKAILCDICETILLLAFPVCKSAIGKAFFIPKTVCRSDIPMVVMLSLMLALTAWIHKKHTRVLGIIMLLVYLFYIFMTV